MPNIRLFRRLPPAIIVLPKMNRRRKSLSTWRPPEPEPAEDPYGDIDFQSFDKYLNDGASRPRETEVFEKPSFENFLAKPQTLTDHLEWQLGLATVEDNIRLACHSIIGNLNEDGYLLAVDENGREIPITLEEIAESGEHTLEDVTEGPRGRSALRSAWRGGARSCASVC